MEESIFIFDKFLGDESHLTEVFSKNKSLRLRWHNKGEVHKYSKFCNYILDFVSRYFNLESTVGYEFWGHFNTKPQSWHYDKDEKVFEKDKKLNYPLCSIIYYLDISDLEGGSLLIEDDKIAPRKDRLIIFPPGKYHKVEQFKGTRKSLLINPWNYKLNLK